MTIDRLTERYRREAIALLDELNVELMGSRSRRLHAALAADSLEGATDCRIALEGARLLGIVLAAPAGYWWSLPARHWDIALEIVRARRPRASGRAVAAVPAPAHAPPDTPCVPFRTGVPPRTWRSPGEAWRIIFVGTASSARGRGVAAALYRSLMAERSLVARVALENVASLHLHQSVGWDLYRDGDGALAVHLRHHTTPQSEPTSRGAPQA